MPAHLRFFIALTRPRKRALVMSVDALLIALAFVLAMVLQGVPLSALADPWVLGFMLIPVALMLVVFTRLGLYRVVMRYITGKSMPILMWGTGASAILMTGVILASGSPIPPSLASIHAMIALLLVSGVRFAMRGLLRRPGQRDRIPVIVYGAGNAGQQLVAALHLGNEYHPVAFVDDDPTLHGTTVSGVRVHASSEMRTLTQRWGVREVLLAMPSINRVRRRQIVSQLEKLGVEVKTIASMSDVVAGRAKLSELRPVTPEDLLGRDIVPPNPDLMSRTIADKVVLVTGAGGTIGSELCRQIVQQRPAALIMLDLSEFALYSITTELRDAMGPDGPRLVPILGSVQNANRIRAVLRRFKVQTIYHAAAYKHVVLVEENIVEGLRNNVFGTRVVAEAAVEAGVETFILVSTDKTVRPCNVMGASKRVAELICQALDTESKTLFCMVRFGNVLGSSGSVIPRFRAQIEKGGPVTVTHRKVRRFFMTITEAAQLVIQAGAMAKGGDVFLLEMGPPVRILDLAKTMIRLHGLTPYVVDEAGQIEGDGGDIPIHLTGLGKGEKLFEELLIGNNPSGTEHPRIMTASEIALSPAELRALLDDLWNACTAFDLARIHAILRAAPLDYRPDGKAIHDLLWSDDPAPNAEGPAPVPVAVPILRVIDGSAGG